MENIKVKNGMKNFGCDNISFLLACPSVPFVQGHTKNLRNDYPVYQTAFLLSLTAYSPSVLSDQDHSGETDFEHDSVRSYADLLCSETGENYKNKGK